MTAPGPQLGEQVRVLADALGALLGPVATEAGGDHSAECRTCPICTALAVLRGQRPDLTEALADLLTTAATALRGWAGTVPPTDDAASPPEETVSPQPQRPAPVQRIEVA